MLRSIALLAATLLSVLLSPAMFTGSTTWIASDGPTSSLDPGATSAASSIATVSSGCSGENAEVEQVVDLSLNYVYEAWMGCGGIAFARSTNGGATFSIPISVLGSVGSNVNVWDPAVAIAPDGTVYVAFMRAKASQWYPVVAASFDHGNSFSQVSPLLPPISKNWGDRPFVAAAPDGTLYVTWSYARDRASVTFGCAPEGGCGLTAGDVNVVIQWSKDQGRSWTQMAQIGPPSPARSETSAPLLVEAGGQIDVLYQAYEVTNPATQALGPARIYFTSSTDGMTWSTPVQIGPADLTMSLDEWWIDGSLGIDEAGNLYATWDTQSATEDVGWLSYSTDHGQNWSEAIRITPDQNNAPHIMKVAGGGAGTAYVGWLSNNSTQGWAMYLRVFSITEGLLTPPLLVSAKYGDRSVWPGDTLGISTLQSNQLVVSWGSGVSVRGKTRSQIFAAILEIDLQ